ncbi:MAG: OmpA family protein [Spirochaetales bacterium]|nr:OmpA family protein [Spirochaetales bacterium]
MRKIPVVVLALLLAALAVGAESFRFRYENGDKYRLVTEVTEDVYYDGALSHRANILNKIAVQTLAVREGAGLLGATFLTSERAYGVNTSFALSEEYESMFWRDQRGRYEIGAEYFMPVVRNVPVFPEGEVSPGDAWSAPGEEAHDLRRSFGIPQPVRFPITVNYTYRGKEQREGLSLDVIDIRYTVFHRLPAYGRQRALVPVRITGESQQTYYWDNQRGQPHSYRESFDFVFHLSSGSTVEYIGVAEGRMLESEPLDREKVAEEISRELEEKGVEDTTVRPDEEGVTVTLQNIQFAANSAELRDSEKEKLQAIGSILRRYPQRDILITGHTARVRGYTEEDHQTLSEARAAAVADYLLRIGAVRETQTATRGRGYREPVADNATEAGRRLNRRVEITILEN